MLKLAVLVSGGGTNLQAVMDAMDAGTITNAQISVVISNNPNAYALERAKNHGIEAGVHFPEELSRQRGLQSGTSCQDSVLRCGPCGSCRLPGGDSGNHGKSLPEPDHQHPSGTDSVFLRNRLLWTESA